LAFMQVELFAESLGMATSVDVIVPQEPVSGRGLEGEHRKPAYPVLYLLHGASDNHTAWRRNTAIERYASDLGIVVVMPSVHYSFYANQKQGLDYFTYVSEELPELMKQFFPLSNRREDTFAAGLSMGGYGAFKLGITYPERFAAVASLSGSLSQRDRLTERPALAHSILLRMAKLSLGTVEEYNNSENDLSWLLEERLEASVKLPSFYQACGTIDHNFEVNKAFHEQFANRIDLTYEEYEGRGHDWAFWDMTIQRALQWLPIGK
jgi:putative tributyrin esterase